MFKNDHVRIESSQERDSALSMAGAAALVSVASVYSKMELLGVKICFSIEIRFSRASRFDMDCHSSTASAQEVSNGNPLSSWANMCIVANVQFHVFITCGSVTGV